ncbi:hypothetical protein QVD17_00960 [Tagetes erecta]|uniref:PRLI-interacting factor A n=1 Tax=Tagetes erecta TaxID=13708 RepID=A0AAD8P7H1_TARER|nr:hypothetical protein QVD17_00960 [Tagetes erecta]
MIAQSQMMNHSQLMSIAQPMPVLNQSQQVMNNQNSQMIINHLMMNQSQSQSQRMLNHRIGGFGYETCTPSQGYVQCSKPRNNNKNWKMKKGNNININLDLANELQQHNRLKPRRYISKKKYNHTSKSAPFAPRNTTSFLIRAKKAGGITSLVSPCPVTPAVLPTPNFSPSREVLVDMAKEEWGVDGYGSMKGLIRLRSPGNESNDENSGSSESDVEEHLDVERRLDHDLSRFEMIYPNYDATCTGTGSDHNVLENRVDDQDTHIARLEESNLMLKNRLYMIEREFSKLKTRLQGLEMQKQRVHGFGEEVVENESENDSVSRRYGGSIEEGNGILEENSVDDKCFNNGDEKIEEDRNDGVSKD